MTNLAGAHPEYFKAPVTFSEVTGNYPYNYWNGGFNNCIGEPCSFNSVFACNQDINMPIRLNCANIFLEKPDFEDAINNTILTLCHDASNSVELCDFDLYEFIKERYPNYRFVFSKEADLVAPMTIEVIDALHEKNYFKLISLPTKFSGDVESLKQLKSRKDIELTVNSICNLKCANYANCHHNQHVCQYNYSGANPYMTCPKRSLYQDSHILISFEDILEKYAPMGITHFRLSEIIDGRMDKILVFFIRYFIKDEY